MSVQLLVLMIVMLDDALSTGETPLDCAPTMLQYKMKQKLEGNA